MSRFRFKQFEVEQSDVAMKVGTDGVLLGAWVSLAGNPQRILDMGTGTGVIALMLAQRSDAAYIAAVDSDDAAARRAELNFAASPWCGRLHSFCSRVQDFGADAPFDLIVSNPPYFANSLLPPDAARTAARHTVDLPFDELEASLCRLMSADGRAALILPVAQMAEFERATSLFAVRRCAVSSVPGAPPKRIMAEFSRIRPAAVAAESLTIERSERGLFSDEYRRLTADFYLKF